MTVRALFTVIAFVLFMLAPVFAPIGDIGELDVIAWGLGFYAVGRIVP